MKGKEIHRKYVNTKIERGAGKKIKGEKLCVCLTDGERGEISDKDKGQPVPGF